MVLAILLLLVFFFVIGIPALAFMLAIVSTGRDEKARRLAVGNADGILGETFTGEPSVTYRSSPKTLPFDLVVSGATDRGYRLSAQADEPGNTKVLVFERS